MKIRKQISSPLAGEGREPVPDPIRDEGEQVLPFSRREAGSDLAGVAAGSGPGPESPKSGLSSEPAIGFMYLVRVIKKKRTAICLNQAYSEDGSKRPQDFQGDPNERLCCPGVCKAS